MAQTKPRGRYTTISISEEFAKEVREHVLNSNRYRSIAEFMRISAMNQIDKDKALK